MAAEHGFETRGRGMMRGINVGSGELADAVTTACFDAGLIIETSGAHGEVVKILAPLIIDDALLASGLDILETRLREAVADDFAVAAESAPHRQETIHAHPQSRRYPQIDRTRVVKGQRGMVLIEPGGC